jgi:hypothetical protein
MRPVSSLRHHLHDLAERFASDVLAAIRGASIEDLVAETGGAKGTPGPARGMRPGARTDGGRLARRTAEDIDSTLGLVVAALRATPEGMRSEEIRDFLKIDKRALPRVLARGLQTKKLRSKGQRRGTTYFAA